MTKRVQILGHDAVTANAFIGEEREVTIDVDNWELRVHDGTTPGGWKILNRDQNDNRYQARSVELDGLLGWEPNERGLVTRLGPANYALRALIVNEDNLTIVNGNGFAGNLELSLAEEIASDHTATGVWTFTQGIIGQGGFIGDLTGDVTGNLTGDVTGNVTGGVTGGGSGDFTGSFTGDVDVRGATLQMDDGTIQLSWLAQEVIDYIIENAVPAGAIIPFAGIIGDIPASWFICDGSNGTPDLTDKFIIGAGGAFDVGDSGGTSTHQHSVTIDSGGAHLHTGTNAGTAISIAQMPAHKHGNGVTNSDADLYCYGTMASPSTPNSIDDNSSNGTLQGYTEEIGGGATHTHDLTIDSGGAHTHAGSTADADVLPPYYALLYIMKGS